MIYSIKRILGGILVFATAVTAWAEPEYRKFESADGATIEATVVEATAVAVTIRRKDGREFKNVPLERFSVQDRKYVRDWRDAKQKAILDADLKPDSRVKISVLKGADEDMNNYGDIDDRIIEFEPGISIFSEEKELTYKKVKGTLVIVGKGVIEKDTYVILNKQDFVIDMIPREKTRWEGNAFQCRYDPDYGGFEYAGYLVVLRNKAGEIVMTKGSKTSWKQNTNAVLNARPLTGYDRNFRKEHSLFTTFGLPQ